MIPCFLETVKQKDCSTWTKYNYFFLLFHSVYTILFPAADSILTRQISSSVCIMLHIQLYFYSPEIFKQKSGIWKKHNHFFQIPHLIIYGSVSGSVSNFNKINLIILCTSFSSTIPETSTTRAYDYNYGDCNTDGVVDLRDAIFLGKYLSGLVAMTRIQLINENCNQLDGTEIVDEKDVQSILRFILLN